MVLSVILFALVWPHKDTIMVFPTYYLVYVCVNLDIGAPFRIVGSLGRVQVFCSSESFFESNKKSTTFCTISGIVKIYTLFQLVLLISFHALGLFWSIAFPFHYRRFKHEGRIKYIHTITVVLALVVPAIPALLHLIDGYHVSPGLLDSCVGSNTVMTYFTTTLPLSILVAIDTSMLIILLWKILKEFILKKQHCSHLKGYVWNAEAKVFVIMFYYISTASVTLCMYSYFLATIDETSEAFQTYFSCQSVGMVPGRDCGERPDVKLRAFSVPVSVAFFLYGLFPIIVLIFVVNCSNNRLCKK